MPSKVESCSDLFERLKLFQPDAKPNGRNFTTHNLLASIPKKELVKDRQKLMKHILDCIGALRLIHEKYNELITDTDTTAITVSCAKDQVFMEAVSLSMTGIFDIPRRDLRVDLLCNAFPGEESQHWFPLHWAMLAGTTIDSTTVEIIYNEDPMAIEQYHQQSYDSFDFFLIILPTLRAST